MPTRTDRKISLAFIGGLIVFALTAFAALGAMQRLARDRALVAHTYDVRGALQQVDAGLRAAKSDVRSFLLTADSGYLAGYRANVDSAVRALAFVRQLTADNAAQQARLDTIGRLVDARLRGFEGTVRLPRAAPSLAVPTVRAQLAAGEALSTSLQASIAKMDSVELALMRSRAQAQDRSERWARLVVEVLAVLGIALAAAMYRSIRRDLAARTRTEEALRESEAKFSGILAIAADAIITIDDAQRIVHFNHGAAEIFGYTEDELLGHPLDILLPERVAVQHRAHVRAFAFAPEQSRRMGQRRQVLGRRRNGEEFPADASISKLTTPHGMLFTVVLRDVTEQRRLARHEHLLAEAGRRLVGTLDYENLLRIATELPVPEIGDWCVIDVAEEAEAGRRELRRVVSSHRDPAIESLLRTLEARGLSEDSPSRVLDVLRTGKAELIQEITPDWIEAHTDREDLPIRRALDPRSALLVPLTVGERVIGVMSVCTTGGRRALDAHDLALTQALADRATLAIENARHYLLAQRATAAREEVLSIVSHDLRNPLSAVAMYARVLLEHPPADDDERRNMYRATLDATDWMHRLMQDLLDAASIDSGRLSIEAEPQSVAHLIEAAIGMFETRAAAQQVTLDAELAQQPPLILADASRILQVLGNILGNALKYTPAGGTVTVGAAPRGAEVLFWVRDTGSGIPTTHLPHLFERFWHARGASRTRGTGLGLAIARGIVNAHGGRIWVESVAGAGSTFFFTLPVADSTAAREQEHQLPHASGTTRPG
ncbi:MAG TPA: ATP-binding protein [Gemmatimonadaceae bacterium]|nr:ATP-binding protein [Gemmatimonadaceae bacterium]